MDGRTVHDKVWLLDFEKPNNNDWLAINQYTAIEDKHHRRPDVVLFINGLPLVVIELKNSANENAATREAESTVFEVSDSQALTSEHRSRNRSTGLFR